MLYRISSIIVCFLIASLISFLIVGLSIGLIAGLVSALGVGLAIGLIAELEPQIRPTEAFIWSWKVLRNHWFLLLVLVFTGALLGILDINTKYIFFSVVVGLVSGGLLGTLFIVLFGGLSESIPEKVSEPRLLRVLAPTALVPFSLFLLFIHTLGKAQSMYKKQKERKEVCQAAKRRELIQRERGGDERPTLSDMRHAIDANHGIKQSIRHCTLVILIFIPLEVLFIMPSNRVAIIGFTGLGLSGSFGFGGLACIQHVILRFLF